MASGIPVVNGDISQGPHQVPGGEGSPPMGSLEETLQQMTVLIKENRDLKEALKQTNYTMKERFEGLSVWKEKQKEEKNFLEGKLEEAKEHVVSLTSQNEELKSRLQILEEKTEGGAGRGEVVSKSSEAEALKGQIARLQAEKNDLVAMNSELQLKMGQGCPEDSFIEIRIAKGEVDVATGLPGAQKDPATPSSPQFDMTASRLESEEITVRQLLQSLRKETQKVERLELELQVMKERLSEPPAPAGRNTESQTSLVMEEMNLLTGEPLRENAVLNQQGPPDDKATNEVEGLKGQMMTLFKDLQQAQGKLDSAEDMKKNLQDRCRDVEQDRAMLRAQLVEKHQVQEENERLKLQLESTQSVVKLEQKKAEDERKNLAQLKEAYTKLFEDYNEMKEERKKKQPLTTEEVCELQARLSAAEQALAAKQQKIDEMKQDLFKKEKELETISVFQAQAEVYSSDFYAERAAREKIHEEKERLAAQLEFLMKQNSHLQEEVESLGRQSLNAMQRRHVSRGASPHGGALHNLQGPRGAEGRDWQQQVNIPEHACPKCNEILPDLDTLQIHIMDCII
ncbi:optineurin-like isoform X2 [Brienomyrus brachyistius]|uniref:optineurin-like isoform X2 n=1 Tax=Brienomyrus brachyistius TaxID=42636 RepID=UPI0020B3A17E|nr:optineurin-like isoform X2 [Brienomyrus brachyistius]